MNIPGLPEYVKRISTTRGAITRLVFTYPFIVDSTIPQNHIDTLRDFFSVAVINQIKISNFLNITSKAVETSPPGGEDVSDIVFRSISGRDMTYAPVRYAQAADQSAAQIDATLKKYEYQTYVLDRIKYISEILKHDIQLKKLNPHITMITIDNKYGLINVPLIVGTKLLASNYNVNYWIILVALLLNRKLNSAENLNYIRSAIERMNPRNFYTLLINRNARADLDRRVRAAIGGHPVSAEQTISPKDVKDRIELFNNSLTILVLNDNRVVIDYESIMSAATKAVYDYISRSATLDEIRRDLTNLLRKYSSDSRVIYAIEAIKYARDILIPSTLEKNKYLSVKIMEDISGVIKNEAEAMIKVWQRALDRNEWDQYVGVASTSINDVFQSAVSKVDPECRQKIAKSFEMFGSYMSSVVNRMLLNYFEIFEIYNQPYEINRIINDTSSYIFSEFTRTAEQLWAELISNMQRKVQGVQSAETIENIISSYREALIPGGIDAKLMRDIEAHVSQIGAASNAGTFIRYFNDISYFTTKLKSYTDSIVAVMNNVFIERISNEHSTDLMKIKNAYENNLNENVKAKLINLLGSPSPETNPVLYQAFSSAFPNADIKSFRSFVSQAALSYLDFMISLITYVSFLSIATTVSDAFRIIHYTVSVIKRDVTDFPNYCVVLPFELLDTFYHVKLSMKVSDVSRELPSDELFKGKVGEKSPVNVVDTIVAYLDIPNIIVINSKAKEFYYRFMFMNRTEKMSLDSVESYVKTQKDIISY